MVNGAQWYVENQDTFVSTIKYRLVWQFSKDKTIIEQLLFAKENPDQSCKAQKHQWKFQNNWWEHLDICNGLAGQDLYIDGSRAVCCISLSF